jgi:hypothetical protein
MERLLTKPERSSKHRRSQSAATDLLRRKPQRAGNEVEQLLTKPERSSKHRRPQSVAGEWLQDAREPIRYEILSFQRTFFFRQSDVQSLQRDTERRKREVEWSNPEAESIHLEI